MLINLGSLAFSGGGTYYTDIFSMVGANSALVTVVGISGTPGSTFSMEGSNDKAVWFPGAVTPLPNIPSTGNKEKLDETYFGFAYGRVKFTPTANGVVGVDVNTYSR